MDGTSNNQSSPVTTGRETIHWMDLGAGMEIHHPRSPGEATGVPCSRRGAPARKKGPIVGMDGMGVLIIDAHGSHGWMLIIPFGASIHTRNHNSHLSVSRLTGQSPPPSMAHPPCRHFRQARCFTADFRGSTDDQQRRQWQSRATTQSEYPSIHPSIPISGRRPCGPANRGAGAFFNASPRHRTCRPGLPLSGLSVPWSS